MLDPPLYMVVISLIVRWFGGEVTGYQPEVVEFPTSEWKSKCRHVLQCFFNYCSSRLAGKINITSNLRLSQNCWGILLASRLPIFVCKIWWVSAIKNIGRERRRIRREKNHRSGEAPTFFFFWDCSYLKSLKECHKSSYGRTATYLVAHLTLCSRAPSWIIRLWYCSFLHIGHDLRPENFSKASKQVCRWINK